MDIDLRGNRYSPSPERVVELTRSLRDLRGEAAGQLRIFELDGTDDRSDLGRMLEQRVFDRAFGKHVPHTPELMVAEYGPYEDESVFFLAVEATSYQPVGVLRIIQGVPNKTLSDLARDRLISPGEADRRYELIPERTWDIGTVAVATDQTEVMAKLAVSTALYHALYRRALQREIKDWTSVIDVRVLRAYDRLGIPFTRFGELPDLSYLGSFARICHLRVADIEASMRARLAETTGAKHDNIVAILYGSESTPEVVVESVIDLRAPDTPPTASPSTLLQHSKKLT